MNNDSTESSHYDLVIIGAGSGNTIPGAVDISDWRVAIIEASKMGGTCLNRGCIPSKILVYTADVADTVRHASNYNIDATLNAVDWQAVKQRLWSRIDPIHDRGLHYRRKHGFDVYEGTARFTGPKQIEVDGAKITADRFVISAGARVAIPDIAGLDTVAYETSDTIMRIDEVPKHLIVLGGGFIATELGHVFAAYGSKVTIIGRRDVLLPAEDAEIAAAFTVAASTWADLILGAEPTRVFATDTGGIAVEVPGRGGMQTVEGDCLLVATGRTPNSDMLNVAAAGVAVNDHGYIAVDDNYSTNIDSIWAFGDIVGFHQLKHTANIEARIVAHNLRPNGNALQSRDRRPAPHAVFSTPQVGAVGMTETQAQAKGADYVAITHEYSNTAYGWALEDTTSFAKLIVDRSTRLLLGAHIVGPQAANLVQLLVQGMHLGATIDELASGQIYIHPALTELVEQALLKAIDTLATLEERLTGSSENGVSG